MDWMLVGCIGSEIRIRTGTAIESRRNIRKPEVRQCSRELLLKLKRKEIEKTQ